MRAISRVRIAWCPKRVAKSARSATRALLALPCLGPATRGGLVPRWARPASSARALACRATSAWREARATRRALAVRLARLVNPAHTRKAESELCAHRSCAHLVTAAGRFNPDIGGSSPAACLVSPRGAYTPAAGSSDYIKCAPGTSAPAAFISPLRTRKRVLSLSQIASAIAMLLHHRLPPIPRRPGILQRLPRWRISA